MSELKIGQSASVSRSFSAEEVKVFADLSLDHNPIHIDKAFAERSMFGQRIVHGMLVSSLFSGLLGEKLPGPGTIYLSQKSSFKKPVFIDQEVTAEVEVVAIREDKPIITLKTTCFSTDREVLVSGEAVVLYKSA